MTTQLKYLSALTLALVSVTPMKAKAQSSPTVLAAKSLNWTVTRTEETKYLIYLPKDYNAQSGKRWPLMLFLHGAGERGTDLQRVAIHGPPMLAKQGKDFPFIIIAPQCPDDRRWENDGLLQLLDHVIASHAVDTNRVYLTGLSMGGYGTWRLGLTHPERFAAIAPICGGGEFIDVLLSSRSKAAALRSLPVWAFHGAKDGVVPLDESERMVNVLKKVGVKDVKLTVYPETDHNSWTETYNNPEFYEWLLKHARK
jgi:predicted peptidase